VVWVGGAVFEAAAQNGDAALVVAEYLVGVGALAPRPRTPAIALGLVLTLAFWALSQDLGEIYGGHATDPNSGPVLALVAIALLGDRQIRSIWRRVRLTVPANTNLRGRDGSGKHTSRI
jgi:hypothetical protein